jgi:hypothetical protein
MIIVEMNEDILNRTVIYMNSSNINFYNNNTYDMYYELIEPIKDAIYIKLMRTEVILNPHATINGLHIEDGDVIFVDLKEYNRVIANLNGLNMRCTDYILLNLSEKFGDKNPPNANISFKSEYSSMSCNPNDTNMIVLNPVEPSFRRFNIQLYDKTGKIISRPSISKFTMVVCIYHKRRKTTQF